MRGTQLLLRGYVAALLLLLTAIPQASGKDLNVLIRITYAAFIAEQGSAMCSLPRLNLSEPDRIVFLNAKNYATWIKQLVSTGLSDQDIQFVLRSAADRARGEMLQVVKVLKSHPPDVETAELIRWCTTIMKNIASEVVGTYLRQPDVIEQLIRKAIED